MENSQSSQDLFVLGSLGYPKKGHYLEIGAGHPTIFSNTFRLEELGWKGFSIDNGDCVLEWNVRKNPLLHINACDFDYSSLPLPHLVDYLSLDIDEATNLALKQIPFYYFDFKVITIEHDYYRLEDFLRTEQREYLDSLGYIRVCSNVCNKGLPYEDWYLHPDYYSGQDKLESMEHSDIIKHYKYALV